MAKEKETKVTDEQLANNEMESVEATTNSEYENNETFIEKNKNSYKDIIKGIINTGGIVLNNVEVKNVNYTEKDNYTMVSMTLFDKIRGHISNDKGATYEIGKTNVIYTSLYAIVGALKEDRNLSWLAIHLLEKPKILSTLFNGCSIKIVQQLIPAGTEYINPFSTQRNPDPQVYPHDIIINNIVEFKLGKKGELVEQMLLSKVLGD